MNNDDIIYIAKLISIIKETNDPEIQTDKFKKFEQKIEIINLQIETNKEYQEKMKKYREQMLNLEKNEKKEVE